MVLLERLGVLQDTKAWSRAVYQRRAVSPWSSSGASWTGPLETADKTRKRQRASICSVRRGASSSVMTCMLTVVAVVPWKTSVRPRVDSLACMYLLASVSMDVKRRDFKLERIVDGRSDYDSCAVTAKTTATASLASSPTARCPTCTNESAADANRVEASCRAVRSVGTASQRIEPACTHIVRCHRCRRCERTTDELDLSVTKLAQSQSENRQRTAPIRIMQIYDMHRRRCLVVFAESALPLDKRSPRQLFRLHVDHRTLSAIQQANHFTRKS